jgi:hypothetical protein
MNNKLFDKFFRNKNGQFVIAQKPNFPIIIWIICLIGSRVFSGIVRDAFSTIGLVAIIIWSLLELFLGVNYFRRILGLIVLLSTIIVKL